MGAYNMIHLKTALWAILILTLPYIANAEEIDWTEIMYSSYISFSDGNWDGIGDSSSTAQTTLPLELKQSLFSYVISKIYPYNKNGLTTWMRHEFGGPGANIKVYSEAETGLSSSSTNPQVVSN